MANNIIRRVWNQNRMVNIEDLYGAAFQAEIGGHTFEISGIDDTGAAVELSGTVSGVFRRPDNADIALTGSASDGVVSVTLSEDCYAVPGRFGLTIFMTSNGQKVAVYACVGTVAVSSTGNVAGDTPANVEDLIDDINAAIADLNSAIGQIPASYANVMAAIAPTYSGSALYSVGSYAWYNGSLYRCNTAITTAEAWTAAHWTAAVLGDDIGDLKSATTEANARLQSIDGIITPTFDLRGTITVTAQGAGSVTPNYYSITDGVRYFIKKGGYVELSDFTNFKIAIYFWNETSWNPNNQGFTERYTFSEDGYAYFKIVKANGTEIFPDDYTGTITINTNTGDIVNLQDEINALEENNGILDDFIFISSINKFNLSKISGGANTSYTVKNNYVIPINNGVEVSLGNYSSGVTLYDSTIKLPAGIYTISAKAKKAKIDGNKQAIIGIVYKETAIKDAATIELSDYNVSERIYHTFTVLSDSEIVVTLQCKGSASDYDDCKMQFTEIQINEGAIPLKYTAYGLTEYAEDVNKLLKSTDSVPDYWTNEVNDTITKVKSHELEIGHRIAEFIFITDTHWIDNRKISPILIQYLTQKLEIPLVIFGGDCVTAHHNTKSGAVSEMREFFSAFAFNKTFWLMSTEGNHDDNSNNNNDAATILTQDELYPEFKKRIEKYGTVDDMDVEGRIAHYDNESQKVRYIVFNKPVNASTGQMSKVESLITNLSADWTVVVISHVYWWSYTNNVLTPNENSDIVAARLASIKANASANIAYWQVGHLHCDYNTTVDNLLIVGTTMDASAEREKMALTPSMTIGTDTEQAFDVVQIDLENKHIYMTRCGAGNDRDFSYV